MKREKTNALRLLEEEHIAYSPHTYDEKLYISADEVAKALNEREEQVFKTLVTTSKSKGLYVFVIPGNAQLDLKKAAKSANEKYIEMLPQKDLIKYTGYVHGGCSPIGMKKKYPTFIDEGALNFDKIFISGGLRGLQIEIKVQDLVDFIQATICNLTT